MRRAYRKPYSLPSHVKHRKKEGKQLAPLVQPAWDDTIHDLTAFKASPDDVVRRKLARTSRNQMGMALLSQSRSAHSGQQERYMPGTADNNDSDAETCSSCSEERAFSHNQQQLLSQQASRQQQQAHSSASKLARYACSAADSEDDVCQWQSPSRPAPQRPVLQDICNNNHAGRGAERAAAHKVPAAASQQEQQQLREQQQHRQRWQQQSRHQQHGSGTLAVDADMMQVLLDKISLLEQQLQRQGGQQIGEGLQDAQHVISSAELQQQLVRSQQQLAATQQELCTLQEEHRQYVAHTSTLITQLQTQMQQLLSTGQALSQQQQPQQQQQQPRPQALCSRPTAVHAGRLQPPALRGQLFVAEGAAAGDSSSSRLQHISNYIQQQLLEPQPGPAAGSGSTAAAFCTTWSAGLMPAAAVGVSMGSSHSASSPTKPCVPPAPNTGMPSPARSPAHKVAASAAASSPARSSPARRKAETRFTAAVTDTLSLPSYSAMRHRGKAVRFCATGDTQVGGSQDPNSSRALAAHLAAANSSEGGNKGIFRSGSSSAAPIGSPRRLHTSPVPQPLSADAARIPQTQQQLQQQQATFCSSGGAAGSGGVLPLNVPSARAAAVWEPELSSPRPQQLQVPEEAAHYPLSKAAAECVAERLAAPAQLGSDLTALLRDLGLASLELQGGSFAQQDVDPSRSSSGLPIGSTASPAAASAAAAGFSVPVVLSEAVAAPPAALAPSLLSSSRGDGVLAGPQDVDWGVQEGLPLAAVGRVYTAAGRVYGKGEAAATRPVLAEGLRGNMCLRDHLRAAAAHAASK